MTDQIPFILDNNYHIIRGFPDGSVVKNPPAVLETWVQSLGQEDPLEKEMATHSSILALKSHGQRSLADYSPWSHKRLEMTEQLNPYHH